MEKSQRAYFKIFRNSFEKFAFVKGGQTSVILTQAKNHPFTIEAEKLNFDN
jgi:hypothetical protein